MSKKFIYLKTLESFLNGGGVSEINKEDICFVEETKQIYTHENYFDCSEYKLPETGIPVKDLENYIQEILNVIISNGLGTKYLSDDGIYKEILTETCKIYVPSESKSVYKSASYWSNYPDMIVEYNY